MRELAKKLEMLRHPIEFADVKFIGFRMWFSTHGRFVLNQIVGYVRPLVHGCRDFDKNLLDGFLCQHAGKNQKSFLLEMSNLLVCKCVVHKASANFSCTRISYTRIIERRIPSGMYNVTPLWSSPTRCHEQAKRTNLPCNSCNRFMGTLEQRQTTPVCELLCVRTIRCCIVENSFAWCFCCW